MELTKINREALLIKLKETNDEILNIESCIRDKAEMFDLVAMWDIDLFLLENQRELIKKSLIDNSIDY